MNPLREAAQQALERLRKYHYGNGFAEDAECIADLEAALAQQAEPDHETRAELAEQQVVQLAEERDHYRNLWQKAQEQAEPLNLSDPAIQKRLAAQWGYVPAAQAEPLEPVAGVVLNEEGRAALVEYGHEEWHCVVRNARRLYTAPPKDKPKPMHPELRKMWEDYFDKCFRAMPVPKQAEPVEPVAWEASEDGRTIQDNDFTHDVVLRVVGDFEDNEQRVRYTQRIVDKLNAAAKAEPVACPCGDRRVDQCPGEWEPGCDLGSNAKYALAQQANHLTIERLRDALVASRIIPPAAVEDPDEYDDGVTLHRIEALHRRIA